MLQNGNKMRTIRKGISGLSQTEMSHYLGITQPTYSRIENGEIDVDLETIQKIAQKLGTDPKNLFNEKEAQDIQNIFNQTIETNFGSANSGPTNYEKDPQMVEVIQDLRKTVETLQGAFSTFLDKLPR